LIEKPPPAPLGLGRWVANVDITNPLKQFPVLAYIYLNDVTVCGSLFFLRKGGREPNWIIFFPKKKLLEKIINSDSLAMSGVLLY
jgi:hypothetical protein